MKCIFCESTGKGSKTEVTNSRKGKHGKDVWRRRKCITCKEIFTTTEYFSYDSLFVVKRNMTRKRFVYEKLFVSILNAISAGKGRDQGDDAMKAKRLTQEIVSAVLLLKSSYISTKDIIHLAYQILEKVDPFYALRYSMYSEYRIKTLEKKRF